MGSVREELCRAIAALEDARIETPRLDAELLLADALGVRRIDLFAHPERAIEDCETERWTERLRRRLRREPVPYITGRVEFFGLPFRVGPGALIPRPETEVLVEAVAARVPENAEILDVGTGTGCIALALAHRLRHARVVGLEPSADALELARENAAALGLADRVRWVHGRLPEEVLSAREFFHHGDGGAALWPRSGQRRGPGPGEARKHGEELEARVDAVVSNPPYIPSVEVDGLAPELREYEPRLALDGGPDGLVLIRSLIEESPRLLRPGGLLAMEMAAGQAERVVGLVAEHRVWRGVEVLADLAGIPRVLVARCGG